MPEPRKPDRMMLIGAAVFLCLGGWMVLEGVLHTISGKPIPATSWTYESSGPEQIVYGLIAVGLGIVLIRVSRKGPPKE